MNHSLSRPALVLQADLDFFFLFLGEDECHLNEDRPCVFCGFLLVALIGLRPHLQMRQHRPFACAEKDEIYFKIKLSLEGSMKSLSIWITLCSSCHA